MSFQGGDKQIPLTRDDARADLEKLSYEEYDIPLVDDQDDGYDSGAAPVTKAPQYNETAFETTTVRCCGGVCCVFLSLLTLAWIVHAIPVSTITDIPPFARSALWMSLAHHTDPWKELQDNFSPPPPSFGDGLGNFPDPELAAKL